MAEERSTQSRPRGGNGALTHEQRQSVVQALGRVLSEQVQRRIPTADLDERDPDYIRETLPGLWLLASFYFRADVKGLEKIPAEGPVLLVGNHSGGNVTPDTLVFSLAFATYFGVERRFFQLAHNLVLAMPGLGTLRKYGTVAASHENARKALETGAALLVYPGGDYEVHRPSWDSAKVDFNGRKGFLRLAIEKDVPVVPLVAIGGEGTAPLLSRRGRPGRLLPPHQKFPLQGPPLSLALPWGLNIGDMMSHLPLPAKITLEALPAIDLREEFGSEPDVDDVYDEVLSRMQGALTGLAAERRFPLLG